jgi:O-antigen ligase
MLGSLVYTPALSYGTDKVFRFISITAVACFAPLFLYTSENRLKVFFYTIIIFAIAMSIESISVQPAQKGEWGFHSAFGSDYTNLARVAGVSLIIVMGTIFSNKKNIPLISILVAIFFINLYSLFYAGSRAPVIAFFVTVSVGWMYMIIFSEYKKKIIISGVIIGIVVIGFILLFQDYFFTLFLRMNELSSSKGFTESTRMRLLSVSMEALNSSWLVPLIGLGTGGFQHVAGSTYDKLGIWPHNILVEVFCENGILGLSIFGYLLLKVYQKMNNLLRSSSDFKAHIYCISGLTLFIFINSLFSSDINGNRVLFTCFGLLYAIDRFHRPQKCLKVN